MKNDFKVKSGEIDVAFQGGAALANRIVVTTSNPGFRIAFLEQNHDNKSVEFRSAVFLSKEDGKQLADLLNSMLKKNE